MRKIKNGLLMLVLCLPLLMTAALSFVAMGEELDVMASDSTVILEDPALIADVADELQDVVMEEAPAETPAETGSETAAEAAPTNAPTDAPADVPSTNPTETPASEPTGIPSDTPTTEPTSAPSDTPTTEPTEAPTEAPTTEPTTEPTTAPTDAPAASYDIVMDAPSGWYANRAVMEIIIHDLGGTGWKNVKIEMGGKGLIDGALASGHVWLDLLENATVTVTITDPYGENHTRSEAVNCIDNTIPTLKASVKGEYLQIEAGDAQSGVAAVQVNGTTYTELSNGTLKLHLKGYADAYEQLLVQAVDKVGNPSKAIAVANPFFKRPAASAPTNAPSSGGSSSSGSSASSNKPKPTKRPSSGSSARPTATPKPTPTPVPTLAPVATAASMLQPVIMPSGTTTSGTPFSGSGNSFTRDLLYDSFTNKQFIAIETKGGDVFYMVIDYDKPLDEDGERYETFFLNLVDSRDLVDIVGELEEREPEVIYVTPAPTAVVTPVTTQEQEPDSTTTLLFVLLVAVAGGGIFLYLKQSKASQKTAAPDFGFDDEDDDEETE